MKNIVSFSGGKDSTGMLLMLLEKGVKVDRIINIDTTKEFPAMYDHIRKVQEMVPVKIETYAFDFDWYFSERVRTRGSRIGQKGYAWPKEYRSPTVDVAVEERAETVRPPAIRPQAVSAPRLFGQRRGGIPLAGSEAPHVGFGFLVGIL